MPKKVTKRKVPKKKKVVKKRKVAPRPSPKIPPAGFLPMKPRPPRVKRPGCKGLKCIPGHKKIH